MYTRTALLAVVVVLAALGGPAVGLAGAADVTLTVTVKTAAGAPLGNADLTAVVDGEEVDTAETAKNGKAFLDVPEGADVTIEVDHPNYVRNSPFEVTDAAAAEVEVTVWEKATASVAVADSDGPVEDVRVVFRKAGDLVRVLQTDGQGTVDSGVIERGEYTLSLFKAGYLRKAVSMNVTGDSTAEVAIERGSVTVEFRVLDDNFDPPNPIGDAEISGEAIGTVPTQPDGKRAVSVPVNTELTVTVRKASYETVSRTVVVRESDMRVNLTTRKEPDVNVELSNERVVVGESLQVTVTDEYGEPLSDATVFLDGTAVGQPAESGTLRVSIESAGDHTLFASVDQLSSDRYTVTGIQPGAEGTAAGPTATPAAESGDDDRAELTVGNLNLRSTAIGVAGGLVLAAVLFVVLRFR